MRRCLATIVGVVSLLTAAPPLAAQPAARLAYSTYRSGSELPTGVIFTIDPDGTDRKRLTKRGGSAHDPVWSPDRSRIAFERYSSPRNSDVWVMDADGSDKRQLTFGHGEDVLPRWSPDGTRIAWYKWRHEEMSGPIYVMDADGSVKRRLATRGAGVPRWSPDGTRVAFSTGGRDCADCELDYDVVVVDADGSGRTVLAEGETLDYGPIWSPDGSRIVYERDTDTGEELVSVAPDGSRREVLASFEASIFYTAWSPDGSRIAVALITAIDPYGTRIDTRLAVVDAATGEKKMLTEVETGGWWPDWAPDGSRIAFLGTHEGERDVLLIDPDGENLEPLARFGTYEAGLDW